MARPDEETCSICRSFASILAILSSVPLLRLLFKLLIRLKVVGFPISLMCRFVRPWNEDAESTGAC